MLCLEPAAARGLVLVVVSSSSLPPTPPPPPPSLTFAGCVPGTLLGEGLISSIQTAPKKSKGKRKKDLFVMGEREKHVDERRAAVETEKQIIGIIGIRKAVAELFHDVLALGGGDSAMVPRPERSRVSLLWVCWQRRGGRGGVCGGVCVCVHTRVHMPEPAQHRQPPYLHRKPLRAPRQHQDAAPRPPRCVCYLRSTRVSQGFSGGSTFPG